MEEINNKPQRRRRDSGGMTTAILFISLGSLLLLNNLGYVPWEVWGLIWRFWPILLIIGGVDMILGDLWISRIVVFVFASLTILFVLAYSISQYNIDFEKYMLDNFPWWSDAERKIPSENLGPKNNNFKSPFNDGVYYYRW